MTKTSVELRQLAGQLDELAQNHSAEASRFRALGLPELSRRALGRALTLRAAMTEIVLMAQQDERFEHTKESQ